jgi:hypothetical protein
MFLCFFMVFIKKGVVGVFQRQAPWRARRRSQAAAAVSFKDPVGIPNQF